MDFEIDPDIARASTLPGRFYTDARVFERLRERVLAPSWQLVGDLAGLRAPGDVAPCAHFDTPLALARDEGGTLRCFSNVCTHRANLVVRAPGRVRELACGYHGRRFGLDGRFRSMPAFEGARDFPGPRDDLAPVEIGTLGPLVFAAPEPAAPFERWIGDVARRLGFLAPDGLVLDASLSRDYEFAAHWALYCENFLEGFHIPFAHPGLNAAIEFESYTTELFPLSSVQIATARPDEEAFDPPDSGPDRGRRVAGCYAWLFPNLMLNFYPWGLSVNVVRPLAIDRTRVSFLAYVGRPGKLGRGAGAGLDRVEAEDEALVLAVQAGVRSPLYERGRYSPTREKGVHHFHRLLAAALS